MTQDFEFPMHQGLITGIPEHLNRSTNHEETLHKPKTKTKAKVKA
jgi:hypothetical protein